MTGRVSTLSCAALVPWDPIPAASRSGVSPAMSVWNLSSACNLDNDPYRPEETGVYRWFGRDIL